MRIQQKWKLGQLTAVLVALSLIVTGCGLHANTSSGADLMEGVVPKTPVGQTAEQDQAVLDSLNAFTWKLIQAMPEDQENRMISPVSVYLALAMTLNGADSDTRTAMLEALSAADLTPEIVNNFAGNYLKLITTESEGFTLSIANSIWLRDGFEADPDFLQKNADYFGAAVRSLDFDNPDAVKVINNWVSEATRETIDQIVDEIDPAVVMYLINAIYFKADWQSQFSPESTFPQPFETPEGSKETDFMHKLMSLEVVENDLGKGVLLPYVNPRMAMLAVLPEEGMSPEAWIQSMDPETFKALMNTAASKTVDLSFPKFETRYEDSLLDELEKLGMGKAFVPGEADFSLMQPSRAKDLFISAVQHKTFIRADEKGTEAAAVTSVEASLTSMPMFDEAISFDRPFVYAILDTETATPLFIGVLNDPTK